MAIKAFHSNNLFKIYPVSQSSVKVIITSEKSKMNSVMMEMKNINNVNNVICKSIIKNYKNKKNSSFNYLVELEKLSQEKYQKIFFIR